MKLKYIPNAICITRGLLAISLIFIPPLSPASITVFLLAGVSDMIDGTIARRIKGARSELGAELDSMADMLLVIVSVFFLLPAFDIWPWQQTAILVALCFKLLSAVPGLIKHRKVFFLHTLSNKVLAMILFMGAIFYFILPGSLAVKIYFVFMIVSVFIITLEEMIIIATLAYPNKNLKGFWEVKRINQEFRQRSEENEASSIEEK